MNKNEIETARIARKVMGDGSPLSQEQKNAYNKWLSKKMGRCDTSGLNASEAAKAHDAHRKDYNSLKEWPNT